MVYGLIFRLILRRMDAERAHEFAAFALRLAGVGLIRRAVCRALGPRDPALQVEAFGRRFSTPLGVAAGLDKDAKIHRGLAACGFGFVEVGTVTLHRQEGRTKPRIERLVEDRALLNRMGFPNDGAEALAQRLEPPRPTVVGVNVGKWQGAAVQQAVDDYRQCVRRLAPVADYLVLNVSSPNTPGLRAMQAAGWLDALIAGVQEELRELGLRVPLLAKLAPDLADEELDAVADVALRRGLDGLVATNTTSEWKAFPSSMLGSDEPAGLSGAPLKVRSLEVLQRLRARVGEQTVLVAVGGIETPEDVWQRILAGATLVQAYTGFIYEGPLWPRRINRGLSRLLRDSGSSSLQAAVGAAAPEPDRAQRIPPGRQGDHAGAVSSAPRQA